MTTGKHARAIWVQITFPWVITFTEPFQMMYHEVPLSPWLNTAPQRPTTPPTVIYTFMSEQ